MSTSRITDVISVEEYLESELVASVKHEYIAGRIYERIDTTNAHNFVVGNALGMLGFRLKDKPCRPFNSDTKIRVRMPDHQRFYYPDLSVVCEQNPLTDTFQDQPVLIIEVLSAVRRVRRGAADPGVWNGTALW